MRRAASGFRSGERADRIFRHVEQEMRIELGPQRAQLGLAGRDLGVKTWRSALRALSIESRK